MTLESTKFTLKMIHNISKLLSETIQMHAVSMQGPRTFKKVRNVNFVTLFG